MSATTTPTFDFDEFKRAVEERDSTAQLALYAPDAEVTLIDRINTPSSPRMLRGHDAHQAVSDLGHPFVVGQAGLAHKRS